MDFHALLADLGGPVEPQPLTTREPGESLWAYYQRHAALIRAEGEVETVQAFKLEKLLEEVRRSPDAELFRADKRAHEQRQRDDRAAARLRALLKNERVWRGAIQGQSWEVNAAVDWWARQKRHGLLRGGVGVGKSAAAARWLWSVLRRDPEASVSWYRADDLIGPMLHDYDERNKPPGKYIVIDEVGEEERLAAFVKALTKLLDEDDGRRILMITNATAEAFRSRYSDRSESGALVESRLLSRLNECALVLDVAGESRRAKDGGF